ncbi:tetratricopeptide repeat protein [Oscillatoria sp. CS-180]|uniref:tetratricopeptide repeat protein n=1 Tax=Oscillatoria sp. CS-180 TaxID=3021720 RepID=UPI00232B8C93|nr:tetratricopeptide repeat protein [Oscillatoria sp. CS-180]MDB9529806.1 tetratricopeptide repeat protein [Oscillatoria sp. CS-180]
MYPRTLVVLALSGLLTSGLAVFSRANASPTTPMLSSSAELQEADVLYRQGILQYEKGNLEAAIALYTDALELNPESAQAYAARAGAWGKLEEYEAAIEDYSSAIRLDEELAAAYGGRGLALSLKGELDAGVNDLWTAAQLFRAQDQLEEYFKTLAIIEDIAP